MDQNTDKEGPNAYITDYLDRYIKKEKPEFAVLLKGKWGIGKTYFIDKYIEDYSHGYKKNWEEAEKTEKKKLVKISLFGLKTIEQLEKVVLSSCIGKGFYNLIRVGSAVGSSALGNVVGWYSGSAKIGDTVKKYE